MVTPELVRTALRSLAYIECEPGKWLKPVGFQCFTYSEELDEWANWFYDAAGKISVWESHKGLDGISNPLVHLKSWECWSRTDIYIKGDSHFELSGLEVIALPLNPNDAK